MSAARLTNELLLRMMHTWSEGTVDAIAAAISLLLLIVAMLLVGVYFEVDGGPHPNFQGVR